ncbi:MAG: RES family NAD+ phosphorylase [Alphaproteobacteria bacterium]|nr:RES family NAD+ phosphorylase [Alphaproteobacteria bacterium]MBU1515243.1 RES family NAD+ phosphorylase [Alphaproteobacteria bacterium]MBU2092373.1 RES family NAD+ phosphorylase [Alphaproteobacteria bacterium]MBU2152967.1 RES family NAD+ phosphorylase [Alphaproteobacteria bacterium]MBU2305798.1 RES family NAD+ phosphorylase [Alphaproteobacteria bacterium]
MIVHRLTLPAHRALDGEGARLYGGRWNSPGRAMIYASASPSLPVLEVMVHLDLDPAYLPDDYHLLGIEVPDDAPMERLDEAPGDTDACAMLGDDFLRRGAALSLSVPSVVVPQDRNLLINPRHPAAAGLRIVTDAPFRFDPRLFAR